MFGSRKNSQPEKCSKMPQTPTRQVHALLARFTQDSLAEKKDIAVKASFFYFFTACILL
jgi:hypothetical protein